MARPAPGGLAEPIQQLDRAPGQVDVVHQQVLGLEEPRALDQARQVR